jgi:hypothetical protein
MKKIKSLYKIAVLLLLTTGAMLPATLRAQAQNKQDKNARISNMVESQRYVFKAQTALPTSGRTRQLTSDFDLQISKDTIASYLPYFGRAYTSPVNPTEGPLNFTSTKFDYKVTNRKKGGWDIVITPQDQQDPRQMALSIFENGSASLTVTSNNRQPIAFNGYITAKK